MMGFTRYENCTLDNYECRDDVQRELVAELKKGLENGFEDNICIIGGVGTGKTHLAYALVKELSERKESKDIFTQKLTVYYNSKKVIYTTIKTIVVDIRRCWGKDADNFDRKNIENYKEYPLLIIDEIGVQYGSESERIELFEIFNARYNNVLPTIIISNNNQEQISKILGQRITDRIFGGAKVFELTGKSHRIGA